jgi:hypothetical protein
MKRIFAISTDFDKLGVRPVLYVVEAAVPEWFD